MVEFKTIVIFDLETTGLPQLEHNCTKITELSLVACLVSHCQQGHLPRVINKLTLGINPMKMITPTASEKSGLENEHLEEMKPFDDGVVSMMNNFLIRLPQPVCLVAHNGNKFDFPIIMKHLLKYNSDFINSIYCADSLVAFEECLSITKIKRNCKTLPFKSGNTMVFDPKLEKRKLNENTPETKTVAYNTMPSKKCLTYLSVCRKLNFSSNENEFQNNGQSTSEANKLQEESSFRNGGTDVSQHQQQLRTPQSSKLEDIYYFLHDGSTYPFHRSEEDCLALLSCIIQCQDKFFKWLPQNARLLNTIKPLF